MSELSLSYYDNIALVDRLRSHGRLTNDYAQEIASRLEELEAQLDKVLNTEIDWHDGPLLVKDLGAVQQALKEDK